MELDQPCSMWYGISAGEIWYRPTLDDAKDERRRSICRYSGYPSQLPVFTIYRACSHLDIRHCQEKRHQDQSKTRIMTTRHADINGRCKRDKWHVVYGIHREETRLLNICFDKSPSWLPVDFIHFTSLHLPLLDQSLPAFPLLTALRMRGVAKMATLRSHAWLRRRWRTTTEDHSDLDSESDSPLHWQSLSLIVKDAHTHSSLFFGTVQAPVWPLRSCIMMEGFRRRQPC